MQFALHIPAGGIGVFRAVRRLRLPAVALFMLSNALCAYAIAAGDKPSPDADARYQQERAACNSGQSSEDRATCLREAAAAHEAARHGQLAEPQENYRQNALARCQALPASDRDACRRRTLGQGETEGSVSSGGILREYREITLPDANGEKKANGTKADGTGERQRQPGRQGTEGAAHPSRTAP